MKKHILFIFSFLFVPSICFAWSGFDSKGQFLFPKDLVDFCQITQSTIKEKNAILDCLDKLEQTKKNSEAEIMRLSSKTLQDFYEYSIATSAAAKFKAANFEPAVEKAEKKETQEESETDDVKENIDEIVQTINDNTEILGEYMQQYAMVVATNSYRNFNENRIMRAPLEESVYDPLEDDNPFEGTGVEIIDPSENIAPIDKEIDYTVPQEYEKLAPNCGDYISTARYQNQDVSTILEICMQERIDNLAQSYTKMYQEEQYRIDRLQESYKKEFDDYTNKALEQTKEENKAKILQKRDEVAQQRQNTIDSKTQANNMWYQLELSKLTSVVLGGG